MTRLVLIVGVAALLAGCDSYYGGAPGYAVNERPTLNQLAGSAFDEDGSYLNGEPRSPTVSMREAKAADSL
jgi:hypothetical protein